jgi:hypothetical protein
MTYSELTSVLDTVYFGRAVTEKEICQKRVCVGRVLCTTYSGLISVFVTMCLRLCDYKQRNGKKIAQQSLVFVLLKRAVINSRSEQSLKGKLSTIKRLLSKTLYQVQTRS